MMNVHQFQVSLAPGNDDGYEYDQSVPSTGALFHNSEVIDQYPPYQTSFDGPVDGSVHASAPHHQPPPPLLQSPQNVVNFTPDLVQSQITSQFNQFHLQTPITQASPTFQSPATGNFQNSFSVLQTPTSAHSVSSHQNLGTYPQEVLTFDNNHHNNALLTSPINFENATNSEYQMFPIAEQSPLLPKASKAKGKILRIPSSASIKKSTSQLKLNTNITPKAKLKVKKAISNRSKDNLLHDEIEEMLKNRNETLNSNSNSSDSSTPSKDNHEMSDFGINIDDLLKYDPFVDLTTSPSNQSNPSRRNSTANHENDDSLVSNFINFESSDKPAITGLGVSYEYANVSNEKDLSPSTLTDLNSTNVSSPILDPSLSTSPMGDQPKYKGNEIIVSKNTKNKKLNDSCESAPITHTSTFPNRVLKKAQSFTNGINTIKNNSGNVSAVSSNTKKRSVSTAVTSTFSLEDCCNEIALAPVNNYSFVYENASGEDAQTKARRGLIPPRPSLRKAYTATNSFINSGPSTGTSTIINPSKNVPSEETSKSLKDMESGMVSFQVQIKK